MSAGEHIPQHLLEGCLKHDRACQQAFYAHYYGYAMSICLRYTASRDEAQDVLNDGFLKVFTRLEQYDRARSLKGWIRRILINTAIDTYRQQHKHFYHDSLEVLQQQELGDPSALDQLSYEELLGQIRALTPAYRAVFNLYVLDGYTHEEIADILGISIGTSKSNLSRARLQLQQRIQQPKKEHGKAKVVDRAVG
ncbi:RNA polymerase sigma factor [Cesiribacter andamanensis]|uniref:RNA polymerase sigma factor n=1 Tax=Cesiribacter andamanensis TaxID=649507 RepID=UPI000344BCF9|nr:RNA polymerase sigma factor [Cesiribacter andamanensis]